MNVPPPINGIPASLCISLSAAAPLTPLLLAAFDGALPDVTP